MLRSSIARIPTSTTTLVDKEPQPRRPLQALSVNNVKRSGAAAGGSDTMVNVKGGGDHGGTVCKPQAAATSFPHNTIHAEMSVHEETKAKNLLLVQQQHFQQQGVSSSSSLELAWEDQVPSIFRSHYASSEDNSSLLDKEESRDSIDEVEEGDERLHHPLAADWNPSWTLKRASPVLDDDEQPGDEDCFTYESPSKKTKLHWESQLLVEQDDSSFDLAAAILRTSR